ncbi:MAG TPA: HD domain-containing phosphohydrolase [Tepidisphaeraceae bacterium]|nr:HD domain-containing phosphohydrolase [Tepidisphaeraceae bacterium]
MRVLIADDDEIALLVLQDTLTAAGYVVDAARDGQEALELLRNGSHQLVVCDWEMPKLSGVELCRAIRAEERPGYTYILLLTSHNSAQERVEGLRAGADEFVPKPFEKEELLARIGTGERVLSMETRDVAIFAMAKLAESRDPETGSHLERVRSYSRVLAQHLAGIDKFRDEITPEFTRLIYLTSPLHDIGKVGIPDSVLLKPGRLSDREFEIMKTHAAIGADTLHAALRQFPGVKFLEMGRDIAATHHERYDGTGYPARLKGEDIPLCGRIVALADVYDALTSKRTYKAAFSHDIARSMILSEAGTHFDPEMVNAFVANESRFLEIRERLADTHAAAA